MTGNLPLPGVKGRHYIGGSIEKTACMAPGALEMAVADPGVASSGYPAAQTNRP